jgi:hypothetical protein
VADSPKPKLFISYSWTTPDHEAWVLNLATELREQNGVDVILDKWDLKEGDDSIAFMERMVTDPTVQKVALICDQAYAEKADGRRGGVGTETQIITPKIYASTEQNKFVAIIAEKDEHGRPYVPTYYKSRIHIDLSDDDLYAVNFEKVLRWVFDKPLYEKPELGQPPAFLSDGPAISLGTSVLYKRALDAVRHGKSYASGALTEYFKTFAMNLERFRISAPDTETVDDQVLASITEFAPYRDEAVELFLAIAQYRQMPESYRQLHRFFEQLVPYGERPEDMHRWDRRQFDNYRFIIHELFLYCIASMLHHECFDGAGYLLRHDYAVEANIHNRSGGMEPFTEFYWGLESLEHRNKRLGLNRRSLHADLLKERATIPALPFDLLMQADFVMFLRDGLDTLRERPMGSWWPVTYVYMVNRERPFPVSLRAASAEYFRRLAVVFDIREPSELDPLMEAYALRRLQVPDTGWGGLPVRALLNHGNMATRA